MEGLLFIIMGKSATGKDTLYKEVLRRQPELLPVIPYTTRPIREGEVDGQAYHFVSEDEMQEMEREGIVIEKRVYHTVKGDWYYFTADDFSDKCAGANNEDTGNQNPDERKSPDHIMIITLEGYENIRDYFGSDRVIPIYIEVDDITRMERSLAREKHEDKPCVAEICRRFLADDEDFSEDKLAKDEIKHRIINDDLDRAVEKVLEVIESYRYS